MGFEYLTPQQRLVKTLIALKPGTYKCFRFVREQGESLANTKKREVFIFKKLAGERFPFKIIGSEDCLDAIDLTINEFNLFVPMENITLLNYGKADTRIH